MVFTSRAGGVSSSPYDSFNLGTHVGDDPADVAANRARLADVLGLPAERFVWMEQLHTNTVTRIDAPSAIPVEATDALVTREKNLALCVLVADCTPVLLSDHTAGVIGAAHAGRMGARNGIVRNTVEAMAEHVYVAAALQVQFVRAASMLPERDLKAVGDGVCPSCGGAGQRIAAADVCTSCQGHGQVRKTRTLNLKIPAGVDDGSRIRLSGEGDAGQRGGPRGDLYVFLSVTPHELFERDNLDLLVTVPVPMTVAALGGVVDAPCLVSEACDGRCKAAVDVPAGAQTGKTVRIKGKGMPHLNGRGRGDLVVELFVETPTDLTARQKELLQELALSFGEGQNPRNSSFAGKAKRFWADILGSQDADGSKENAA